MAFCGEWHACLRDAEDGAALTLASEPGRPAPEHVQVDGLTVVLDGVLFDRQALARSAGVAADASQAATLAAAYLRAGEAMLPKLRGRFSLVLWDSRRAELLALRDPVGVRPLFHASGEHGFLVSPYQDVLLRQPGVDRRIDAMVAAGQMIIGLDSAPEETVFAGVRRIAAGHVLRVRAGVRTVSRYWEPTSPAEARDQPEQFGALLDQALLRCHGGGRFGVFLSGGLDSATVATAAMRASRSLGVDPPCGIAILNPTPESDEEPTQRAVASALDLTLLAVRPGEAPDGETSLEAALELARETPWPPGILQPLGDRMSRRAIDAGCGTILTGDGGDEWLVPFSSWATQRALRLDVRSLALLARSWDYAWPGMGRRDRARGLLWTWGARPILRHAAARVLGVWKPARLREARFSRLTSGWPSWLVPEPARRREVADWWIERSPEIAPREMHRVEKRNLLTRIPTTATMEYHFATGRRVGVEMLTPLWDADLIGFLAGLPEATLVAGGRAKALARDYIVPDIAFADSWPGKTLGDSVIAALLEREARHVWHVTGGAPILAGLGLVDEDRLGAVVTGGLDGPSSDRWKLWDTLALEAWLSLRIVPEHVAGEH